MAALDSQAEITSLLEAWDRDDGNGSIPIDTLVRMAELVERETEAYFKMDPDPFDDRHPGRADPSCGLGHLLKAVFKNDAFMTKLVGSYFLERAHPDLDRLQIVTCRLLLGLMPGLEASIVFADNEMTINKLFQWAETADDPLKSYATGVLAAAVECQDLATNYKDKNAHLVPIMLKRLYRLKDAVDEPTVSDRPFANLKMSLASNTGTEASSSYKTAQEELNSTCTVTGDIKLMASLGVSPSDCSQILTNVSDETINTTNGVKCTDTSSIKIKGSNGTSPEDASSGQDTFISVASKQTQQSATFQNANKDIVNAANDCSNSSWAEVEQYVIGSYKLSPLSKTMKERLILMYLIPLGEYQELLSYVFEHRAIDLIFYYIDLKKNRDVRLAFGGLRYLASLLCHKKFAVEFINNAGIQRLLEVYRPSVAATGVSLCLYYLAYYEDAMERVCLLPQHVLAELVNVVLWMLECSHQSGRCHAVMFFSMSFSFRVILDLFDRRDGLRKLFNAMSTLELMNIESSHDNMTEDEEYTSRQSIRHVCVALKRYFEVHLAIKADEMRRSHVRTEGGSPLLETPPFKAIHFSVDAVYDNMDILLEYLPQRNFWPPVAELDRLGGISLLLQFVSMATAWTAYTGKAESICCALNTLAVCAVTHQVQVQFTEPVPLPAGSKESAIRILLDVADGETLAEPDVQKSALSLLNNLLCGPTVRVGGTFMSGSTRKRMRVRPVQGDEVTTKLWDVFRSENGIMVLLKLLHIKSPITEADAIRALTCKSLLGLARSENMRQIMSKLPLFNNGQLQQLMKEPILQDKRHEHVKFCKYANELTELVSGKAASVGIDNSLETIRRATVVAETKILYDEKELLQLIQEHLVSKGLMDTAYALQQEATLPRCATPPAPHPTTPQIYSSTQRMVKANMPSAPNFPTPTTSRPCPSTPGTPYGPIRVNILQSKAHSSPSLNIGPTRVSRGVKGSRLKMDAAGVYNSPGCAGGISRRTLPRSQDNSVSLNKIVTEYLKQQHALCKNPIVTCPVFSLLEPHRCPDPKQYSTAPSNMTSRFLRRSAFPKFGGPEGDRYDRKYIYSRFRQIRSYRDNEADGCFSCCAFSSCEQWMMLGTYAGELKLYNMITAEEAGAYVCHTSPLTHLEPSRDGMLVLTSSSWGTPLSACWTLGDVFDVKLNFEDDHYVEFSKVVQDRIVGTKEDTAKIYDVATGQPILTLADERLANKYTRNRATFDPSDDLVLSDGVLWDVNSGKAIHKFDKFNPHVSGVFHPMGLEIIINSEVWDIRTYKLLHTVPALDQCHIRFNNTGDIIYGAIHQVDDDDIMSDTPVKSPFGSSFRTFDASDYSNIATIDVKKNIFDLCTDNSDCYLAVIENTKNPENFSEESICRLYEVGRLKEEDEEEADEEDDTNMDEEEDDDEEDLSDVEVMMPPDDELNLEDLMEEMLEDEYSPEELDMDTEENIEEAPSVGSYRLSQLTSEDQSENQSTHVENTGVAIIPASNESVESLNDLLTFEESLALFPDLLLPVTLSEAAVLPGCDVGSLGTNDCRVPHEVSDEGMFDNGSSLEASNSACSAQNTPPPYDIKMVEQVATEDTNAKEPDTCLPCHDDKMEYNGRNEKTRPTSEAVNECAKVAEVAPRTQGGPLSSQSYPSTDELPGNDSPDMQHDNSILPKTSQPQVDHVAMSGTKSSPADETRSDSGGVPTNTGSTSPLTLQSVSRSDTMPADTSKKDVALKSPPSHLAESPSNRHSLKRKTSQSDTQQEDLKESPGHKYPLRTRSLQSDTQREDFTESPSNRYSLRTRSPLSNTLCEDSRESPGHRYPVRTRSPLPCAQQDESRDSPGHRYPLRTRSPQSDTQREDSTESPSHRYPVRTRSPLPCAQQDESRDSPGHRYPLRTRSPQSDTQREDSTESPSHRYPLRTRSPQSDSQREDSRESPNHRYPVRTRSPLSGTQQEDMRESPGHRYPLRTRSPQSSTQRGDTRDSPSHKYPLTTKTNHPNSRHVDSEEILHPNAEETGDDSNNVDGDEDENANFDEDDDDVIVVDSSSDDNGGEDDDSDDDILFELSDNSNW